MQMVLTTYDLFSWNKYDIHFDINDNLITFEYIDKSPLRMLSLCTLGPLHHACLFFPSYSCSMLSPSLRGVDCLSRFLSGGTGPPSPPSPDLTPFPSGNALPLCWAQKWCLFSNNAVFTNIQLCKGILNLVWKMLEFWTMALSCIEWWQKNIKKRSKKSLACVPFLNGLK